ncbi:LysR substrate-binding domain-containing protein [Bosea sp. TAF32]|uniref:LysR substrate-binding domain-containing protein n=1 Tax=Bosea sp. TAF32 TaxID=3237482 RepID=UPI003F8F51F9
MNEIHAAAPNVIRRTLPPLATLRVFEAAGRLCSFKNAALELNLTQSAISHQIASLERNLGTQLFIRKPGRVELSQKGTLYLSVIQDALDRISLTTDLIREAPAKGSLTVQVYVTVAVRWLIPRLHHFNEVSPEVTVSLNAGLLDWDFNPDHADVGLVYSRTPERARVSYTLLRKERLVAVCSQTIAEAISSPQDLSHFPFLSIAGAAEDTAIWAQSLGLPALLHKSAPRYDSTLLAIEAAMNGQGLVVVPHFLVEADLRSGNLTIPVPADVMQPGGWYLAHLQRRGNERPIREFLRWIQSQ